MVQASQKWGLCFDSGRQNNLNKESFDQPEKSNSNWFIINEYNHQRLRFSIRNVSLKVQWNICDMIFLQFSFCTSSCMWYSMWLKKHGEAVRQRLPAAVAEVTALSLISQQPVVLWQHVNMQKKKKPSALQLAGFNSHSHCDRPIKAATCTQHMRLFPWQMCPVCVCVSTHLHLKWNCSPFLHIRLVIIYF